MLAVTTGTIKPSKQNQDTAAAQAAAQAGVQAYLASLDANCRPNSITVCTWLHNQAQTPLTGTIGVESYSTRALGHRRLHQRRERRPAATDLDRHLTGRFGERGHRNR